MKRACAMLAIALGLTGCTSGPGVDPFLRTRIPPEGTGPVAAPYYPTQPSARAPVVTPPPTSTAPAAATPLVPGPTTPGATHPLAPPSGSFNLPQTSSDRGKRAAGLAESRSATPADDTGRPQDRPLSSIALDDTDPTRGTMVNRPAGRRRMSAPGDADQRRAVTVAYNEPLAEGAIEAQVEAESPDPAAARDPFRVADRESAASSAEPAAETPVEPIARSAPLRLGGGSSSLRIVATHDESAQPEAAEAAPQVEALEERSGVGESPWKVVGSVRPCSESPVVATGFREVVREGAAAAAPSSGSATFGHDADYRWLRGKLEYSASARQWKLRYIPINGQTDQYGGSVVLDGQEHLAQLQPGQWVTAHGRVSAGRAGRGFAPVYELNRLEPAL